MTFKEISEKAFKKQEIDKVCNIAEKYAYLQLKELYLDYKNELISKEEAEKKKKRIELEYNEYQKKIHEYYEVFKTQNDIRIKYETYLNEIEKTKNQDDLLEKSLKLIELIIQDKSFFKRNYEKN